MTEIDRFVCRLAEVSLPNVFNPYSDLCEEHDGPDAPLRRRTNLSNALSAALELEVRTIWIARDLGYRGGRRTGLALTDEAHLAEHATLLGGIDVQRATRGPAMAERTSTVIWNMVGRVEEPIFMWNIFPLHPHEAGDPMTNRCHTRDERAETDWALSSLLKFLRPDHVYAIGGDAKRGLEAFGVEATAFRHPSYGGQTQFVREVETAYGLTSQATRPFAPAQLNLDVDLDTFRLSHPSPSIHGKSEACMNRSKVV